VTVFEHVTMDPEKARWLGTGIPQALRGITLDDIEEMGGRPEQLKTVRDWVDQLPVQQQRDPSSNIPVHRMIFGRGLRMFGGPGTGKTTMAIAAACQVRINYKKSVYFTRFPTYIDTLRSVMHATQNTDHEQLSRWCSTVDSVESAHVVVLDDVGHEHRTDSKYAEDVLHDLVRRRYEAGNPTIILTNLTGPQWIERYSPAFASFMTQATLRVEFPEDDSFRGAE
jgi:DNA replication protein DnaC